MARPQKCRRVAFLSNITYYKPAGIPLKDLEEIALSVEEAEALRLKELEGLEQEEGATRMNISRPTFQRILAGARKKLADALLNGKAIRIEGGNFELTKRRFRCNRGYEWEVETPDSLPPGICPRCRARKIQPAESDGQSTGNRNYPLQCCRARGFKEEAGN